MSLELTPDSKPQGSQHGPEDELAVKCVSDSPTRTIVTDSRHCTHLQWRLVLLAIANWD